MSNQPAQFTPPGEALPASALPLPHEVLVWRGMKATPTVVLIDAFVVGDQLEKALIEETARRRRAEVLLFATQQAYVREHEAVVQSETALTDEKGRPMTYWGGAASPDKRHGGSPLTEHEIQVLREEMLSDDGFLPEGKERVARLCDMALASIAPSAVAHSDCPDCGGTGSTPISTCLRCGGTGSLQSARAPLTDKELGEAYMAGVLASGKNADESEGHYAGLRAVLVAADSRSANG